MAKFRKREYGGGMFHKLRPEYMPSEDIKKVNRPNDWAYFSAALKEAGDAVDRALNGGENDELMEKISIYRRALTEVTQTSFARTASDRNKIKALEDKLERFASDLNKALIAGDRHLVRTTLQKLSYSE